MSDERKRIVGAMSAEQALMIVTADRDAGNEAIAELRARLDAAERERDRLYSLAKANNDLARMMTNERKALREALQPFAGHVGKDGSAVKLTIGESTWTGTLTTDDFTKARRLLTPPYILTANHSAPQEQQP